MCMELSSERIAAGKICIERIDVKRFYRVMPVRSPKKNGVLAFGFCLIGEAYASVIR